MLVERHVTPPTRQEDTVLPGRLAQKRFLVPNSEQGEHPAKISLDNPRLPRYSYAYMLTISHNKYHRDTQSVADPHGYPTDLDGFSPVTH